MNRINKNNLKNDLNKIPETQGIFICNSNDAPIFFKITENLRKFVDIYLLMETEEANLLDLRRDTEYVDYTESQDLFFCLLEEKLFFDQHHPEYNNQIKVWKDYSYLSLQWDDVPYIKTSSDTLSSNIYLGPFRNSFFLQDLLDTFSDIYKLPACDDEIFPCDKMNINRCAGYCVFNQDDSLKQILINFYLFPNIQILNDIRKKIEQYEEELNFQQSEIMTEQLKIIESYYRQLLFLYTSRFINYELDLNQLKVKISNGLISEIKLNNRTLTYNKEDAPRENELLVLNKDELDERWIIYRYFENHYSDYLKKQFHANHLEIRNRIISFVDNKEI